MSGSLLRRPASGEDPKIPLETAAAGLARADTSSERSQVPPTASRMTPAGSESEWMANLWGSRQLDPLAAGRSGDSVDRGRAESLRRGAPSVDSSCATPSTAARTNKVESDLAAEGLILSEAPRAVEPDEDPTPMETPARIAAPRTLSRTEVRILAVSGQPLGHLPA